MREKAGEAGTVELHAVVLVDDRETHGRCRAGYAEFGEQAGEGGVVAVVVDDEAGVDRNGAAVHFKIVGVRVSAEALLGFEHRDVVRVAEEPGGREAGDPCPDYRDTH